MLSADGILRASGADISGSIHATDGEFTGIVNGIGGYFDNIGIGKGSTFRGDIKKDVFVASSESSSPGEDIIFASGTPVASVWNNLGKSGNSQTFDIYSGTYNGKSNVDRLGFVYIPPSSSSLQRYLMYVYWQDGTTLQVIQNINSQLTIVKGTPGKTFKFIGLPSGGASNVGDIYEDNGFLKIKK